MNTRTLGLSVMETLIAMLLIGVVLSAVVRLEVGATQFSAQRTVESQALNAMKDALGYVGDQIKTAVAIRTTVTLNGQTCSITSTTNPCFAMVVPVTARTDPTSPTTIDTYHLLVYSLERRNLTPSAYKFNDTWADSNTYTLKEYRSTLCQDTTLTPCNNTIPTVATTPVVTNTNWGLIANDLSLTNSSNNTVTPFAYNATTKQVTLSLVAARRVLSKNYYVPKTGTMSMSVKTRNL